MKAAKRIHVPDRHPKAMRAALTEPERKLWRALRQGLPLGGTHFRRQVPIGSYIVDFCGLAARLVIEVDGNQHGSEGAQSYGAERTRLIESHGVRVLRFANEDVVRAFDSVLDTIAAALDPTPNPAPQWPAEEHTAHG